jgi:GTP-binding protein
LPEIAFAGRSNVGKSSLINAILGRKNLVKVSGRPGKTQGLNFFLVSGCFHLVDLPGYGFAKVSKTMQAEWGELISAYLQNRNQLKCVVVIMDLRHEAKKQDSDLLSWLSTNGIPVIGVYTKADKLSRNKIEKHARALDAGHGIPAAKRVIFSSKSGLGRDRFVDLLAQHLHQG